MPAILGVIALWGIISGTLSRIAQVLLQPIVNHLQALDPNVPLSPADLADMVERNILDEATAIGEARESGMQDVDFQRLVLDTGEPPGIEQMLSLWRRNLLDEELLDRMIAYSRIRTEWTSWVKLLAHDTMSPGDAIEGALKGVLDHDTAATYFEMGGGLPDQFDTLLALSGNPIGVEAALNLWNHNLITEDQVTQVILHSRINPQFESMAKLLRHRFLAPFQVSQALKAGAVAPEVATQWLLQDGYPADQVAGIVAEGTGTKVAKHKDLTEAQITELYDSGLFNHDEATAHLVNLGYDPTETDFILAVYDQRRELTMAQAAINQVRKVFLAGRIDGPTATAQLASLGVDPVAQQTYLAIWAVEQASELKELTAAQVGTAAKDGIISYDEAAARWVAMGYSSDDAAILVGIHGGPPPAGSPAAAAAPAAPAA